MQTVEATRLNRNPFAFAEFLSRQRDQLEADRRQAGFKEAGIHPHGYIFVNRSFCEHHQAIPILCSDPLCSHCERIKSTERGRRWFPVVKRMRSPRMITLTIPNGADPQECKERLQAAFRALLELRVGTRNINKLCDAAAEFAKRHFTDQLLNNQVNSVQCQEAITRHTNSINRFRISIKKRAGQWPKMRHLIGPGFASLEVTYNPETGYHFHRHLCTDGQFIPWAFLCVAWLKVTDNQASITDIRSIDQTEEGLQEVVKYVTKGWDIPEDEKPSLAAALRGVKRIWPLGGAKPEKPIKLCPYCKDLSCKATMGAPCHLLEAGECWGSKYQIFETEGVGAVKFIVIRWVTGELDEVPLLDTLRVCAAFEHSPGGPPCPN